METRTSGSEGGPGRRTGREAGPSPWSDPYPEMGKGIRYGVYDVFADEGWVSVGDHHDTAAFAVATIRRWWERMGRARYPDATRLMITADAGGSNAARSRLWMCNPANPDTHSG